MFQSGLMRSACPPLLRMLSRYPITFREINNKLLFDKHKGSYTYILREIKMNNKKEVDKHYQTIEEVKTHYELETKLASTLRNAGKEERRFLYTSVYNQLYQMLPNNSIALRKNDPQVLAWVVAQRMQLIKPFLGPELTFVELGPGDCSLTLEVARHVKKAYAVDVTKEFKEELSFISNFELVISDGSSIPLTDESVDVVYSHQVMEHLHPEDALDQLREIMRVLVPGGVYICITPNRLSGPHDISWHFDSVATGLHLKEYTVTELYDLFCIVNFSKISYCKSYKNNHVFIPLSRSVRFLLRNLEDIVNLFPYPLRRKVAGIPLLFRGMTIIGTK
jgi:ubiquinone/menaquinone biosynthesis C-methylase UbiE